jgi:hypothetical protein
VAAVSVALHRVSALNATLISRGLGKVQRQLLEILNSEDRAAIAALLRDTIAADRFPLSQLIKRMRAILKKLDLPATFTPMRPRPAR